MNKIHAALAVAFVALSTSAFAQDRLPDPGNDAARQERMNEAYSAHRSSLGSTVREDTHRAGHAIHDGVRATGHAVHNGVRATGHAIHRGVSATGHAIHRGVDKVTGN